jgi:hypothetical protein
LEGLPVESDLAVADGLDVDGIDCIYEELFESSLNVVVFTPFSDLFVVDANGFANDGSAGTGCNGWLCAGVDNDSEGCGVDVGIEGIRDDHSEITIAATTLAGNGGGFFF